MRRSDDGHVSRPPPFRVLAAPDANYLSPLSAPPPPRAPEPYKVAPSSTSFSRAHRRSSFVIIAESKPATPESRSPSPTLATGRVSPFRGRGFKGPPPRSRSRPQSPEPRDGQRRLRNDRRVSVSQQSSPRRSLIPQPTRQRSSSLTKANGRPSSPKIGRRVDSRSRLNLSDSRNRVNATNNGITNLSTRRQATKSSTRLSPIQGTPTKPEKTNPQYSRGGRANVSRVSPMKTPRFSGPASRTPSNAKKPNQEKNKAPEKASSKDRLTSPSKIPKAKNGTNPLNPARFITISSQPNDKSAKKNDRVFKELSNEDEAAKEPGQNVENESKETGQKNGSSADVNLIDLVKQSSGATGTSSVVNTTATTAVQPLHIDANAVVEKNGGQKSVVSEKVKSQDPQTGRSSNSPAPVDDSAKQQGSQNTAEDSVSKAPKPGASLARAKIAERIDSPAAVEKAGGHSKNSSVGQSSKNFSRTNSTTTVAGSATQRLNKSQIALNDPATKSGKAEQKDEPSAQTATATGKSDATNDAKTISTNAEVQRVAAPGSALEKTADSKATNDLEMKSSTTIAATATNASQETPVPTAKSVPANNAVGAVNDSRNVESARVRNDNGGSNASLKSSAGISVDSIESARSTDTGVSVNTVRGVSSPREKTGMHVVKRPQEIETLSGNVMHVEQNGEPAVLAAANGVGERVSERLLTRWRRSVSRCSEYCRNMRCLACRANPKGLAWPRKQARTTTTANRTEVAPQATAEAAENAPPGCWTKFKNRCRCKRLREIKCCAKRSRVAPAEPVVCCPPERRFGAICRRLFDRCKCKRAEAERTRSIRAKHSLTSVAPPPLSEEPKCKLPDVLVEHNSLMRGAIPCLPVPLAWFCLVWNVLLPGSGSVWSGIFNLCTGQPRFSAVASMKSRLGSFIVNLIVGVGQLFTVLFCLVGWGWSIWWGVTLVRLARKYKRFKASEAANNDPEARGGDVPLPPGVPSHALRGMERAR